MLNSTSLAILAGGESRRMSGVDKALIRLGGLTIIDRIIDSAGSLFSEILIVTNKPEEFVDYTLCKIISDQFVSMGPLGGIHAALKSSQEGYVFFLACDMPLVSSEIIRNQIGFFLENDFEIVAASINNKIEPLHSLFDVSVASRLEDYLKTNKNPSVRNFIKLCRTGYFEIESTDPKLKAFSNINTSEDLNKLRRDLGY